MAFGTLTIVACGFVLAAIVASSTAVTAVGLAILLPVAFFSGIFTIGLTPNWMNAIGSMLPMKPIATSLAAALNPVGPTVNWIDLAVLCGWLAVAGAVCLRVFSWSRETGTRAER